MQEKDENYWKYDNQIVRTKKVSYKNIENNKYFKITTTSMSPNGKIKSYLIELDRWVDRNFVIGIRDISQDTINILFTSPDECSPGSEKFIWSDDSNELILISNKLWIDENLQNIKLPDENNIYWYINFSDNNQLCNASQTNMKRVFLNDISSSLKLKLLKK